VNPVRELDAANPHVQFDEREVETDLLSAGTAPPLDSTLACLFLSIAMLEGRLFTRATAIIGIIANGLGLGYFFTVAFAPPLTFIPLSSSAPLLIAWYILIGIRLLRLSRPVAK
jgi:hypothetical protein